MGATVAGKGDEAGGRRRRYRRGGRARPIAEINVTPLVDVMLVLLIIFMVSAPLMTAGVPVDLPRSAAGALPAGQEEPLTVTLAADGRILVQTSEVDPQALVPRLRAIAAERNSPRIYLRADGSIPYERVMQVMGALNAAGFRSIALVTEVGGPRLDGDGN